MIKIDKLSLSLDTDFENLRPIAAKALRINVKDVISARLYKKSVDARHKNDVHFCCSVVADIRSDEIKATKKCKNAVIFNKKEYKWLKCEKSPKNRPIVVGFGPAGMFCALTLARAGLKPLVIERGSDADRRKAVVESFFSGAPLNEECNVQFGEGGAGTFSDGKLTTGIKNPKCRTVLEILSQKGAGERILIDAKPHIGTDILVGVVKNIREEITSLGGEVLFDTRLDNIVISNGKLTEITSGNKSYKCDNMVLATGHSARDTYRMLLENGVQMVQKPFSVGVRIEHLQSDINKALYGEFAENKNLSAADYKLACHLKNGRGVYTFCMCPGGEVINSSSERGGLTVNGMSNSRRDGINSNSALLVGIEPTDFSGDDVLAGCRLQEKIEKCAFDLNKGNVPVDTVGHFVFGEEFEITKVEPTVKPQYDFGDFTKIFPEFVTESLKEGIKEFGKKISGFDAPWAVLTAPETRSSAPVRILRNESMESISVKGLYPCGEGAGFAGGIVSAAVDGMEVAERIINLYKD